MHPSSLGPNLFPSSPYGVGDMAEGCFLHSPSSSAITEGVNSICWIEVLGAPIPVRDFPCSLVGKESARDAGGPGLIPELGGSPGEGNGNLLQSSCLENPIDRRAWRATVHGVAEADRTEQLTLILSAVNTQRDKFPALHLACKVRVRT